MAKPGPKKTPVAKLKRRKTYRPGRHAEPAKRSGARPSVPKPPAALCKEAKQFWKQLAGGLVERDLLTEINLPTFAIFCESLAEYWLHRGQLKKAGDWFVKTTNTKKIQSPAVEMMNRAANKVRDFGAQLGISSDGTNLDPNSESHDAFLEFLNRSHEPRPVGH